MKVKVFVMALCLAVCGPSCSFHPSLDTEKYWPCMPDNDCPEGCSCMEGQVCVPDEKGADSSVCAWCPRGYADCDEDLKNGCEVELLKYPEHWCGCNAPCREGMLCQGRDCVSECSEGFQDCGTGWCVDVMANPEHCGICENECDPGDVCSGGFCAGSCTSPLTNCEGACVNLESDIYHCGECDNACAMWHACCEGECLQVKYDTLNCGDCGVECEPGQVCDHGECLDCPAGFEVCGHECVDFSNDPNHCGECWKPCEAGQACVDGQCSQACEDNLTNCGGVCVDTMINHGNCGECDIACGTQQKCELGECIDICQAGETLCGDFCVDTSMSAEHCGGCFQPCIEPPASHCDEFGNNDLITYTTPGTCENNQCFYDSAMVNCPFGCVNDKCLGDPCAGVTCREFEECINGGCICIAAEAACLDGLACCETGCYDLSSNNFNCGECGVTCPHKMECVNAGCQCLADHGNCDNIWDNGCEEVLVNNFLHCGECDNTCDWLPPPECIDDGTLVTYIDSYCQERACGFWSEEYQCPWGCAEGECLPDPCIDVQCAEYETCLGGICYCGSAGGTICSNDTLCCGEACVNTDIDPIHCGECFNTCVTDLMCHMGQCGKIGVECAWGVICDDANNEVCCTMGTSTATCTADMQCNVGLVECDGPEDCGNDMVCCHAEGLAASVTKCMYLGECTQMPGSVVLCTSHAQCQEISPDMVCMPATWFGLNIHYCGYTTGP